MLEFIFSIFFGFLALIFAFYIPGRVILGKEPKLNPLIITICALIIGMVMWGWQGYIFGYLQIRFLSYVYLIIFLAFFIYKKYYIIKLNKSFTFDFLALAMIIVGTFGQVFAFINTGRMTEKGIYLSPFNPPDHMWHTSLINEMVKRFPPHEPGMHDILVTNYHYWFNLVTAELIRVFHLPLFQTQYIVIYIFGSIMLGATAYVFSKAIINSHSFTRFLLFFLYFGGDASYWLSFITSGFINFNIPSIIDHASIFMDNPPRAFSIIVLFVAIFFLFIKIRELSPKNIFIISILSGALVGFKIYTGMLMISGLGFLALYFLVFKKNIRVLVMLFLSIILSLIIFLPVNAGAGGMFFNPFDRPREFVTYQPLELIYLELRYRIYMEHQSYLRVIQYGSIMTFIYLFAQFGVKILGLIPYKKMLKVLDAEKKVFIYGAMFSTFGIGLIFNQTAHHSDSFNFYVAGAIFLTILTSLSLALFIEKKNKIIKATVIIFIVVFTLPRWLIVQHSNLQRFSSPVNGFFGVSHEEIKSYNFLKKNTQTNAVVLVFNEKNPDNYSANINVFTDRAMFLSGQGVIEAHNAMNKAKQNAVDKMRKTKNTKDFVDALRSNHINYVYLYKNNELNIDLKTIEDLKVFENNIAIIYKVQ